MLKAHIVDNFKNLLEYQEWVKDSVANISDANKVSVQRFERSSIESMISMSKKWFGEGVTFDELAKGITNYKSPELIQRLLGRVNDKMTTRTKDQIKTRRVKFNANGLGIFIFDRASMGMYRLKEFYSDKHEQVVQREQVKEVNKNFKLISDGSKVIERWEQKPDGKPKVRTTNKNVYAYFPPLNKENKAVELFLTCGGYAGVDSDQFLYSGMSAIVIAQLLEKARIKTKITIVIGSSPDGFKRNAYAVVVPVKNYDEALDINLIALLSSDPRFFRYEGFKGVVSLYDYFGVEAPGSLGTAMTRDYLYKTIEESDYSKRAKLAPNRFYLGGTFTERDALRMIENTIEEIAERINQ